MQISLKKTFLFRQSIQNIRNTLNMIQNFMQFNVFLVVYDKIFEDSKKPSAASQDMINYGSPLLLVFFAPL